MATRIPYGIDPDETFELDFCLEQATGLVEIRERILRNAKERATRGDAVEGASKPGAETELLTAEKALEAARAELAAYVPGTGPIFVVGHIPNGKRAEISGESGELAQLGPGSATEKRGREWSEGVVRWAVRGHRNLTTRSGKTIPFVTVEETWLGEPRQLVARKTLEAYQVVIDELALLILRAQRLGETGKNA